MFTKLKNKFMSRRQSTDSDASSMEDYKMMEPRTSTSSTPAAAYRSRWASMSSEPDTPLPSSSNTTTKASSRPARSMSRGRSTGSIPTRKAMTPTPSKSRPAGGRRKRDIFWRNSLWDESSATPPGQMIRAKSQSVSIMHPEVAEEHMRNMPHYNWRV